MKSKKQEYIEKNFNLLEKEAEEIVHACTILNMEKYIVWVAKEYKKNSLVLNIEKLANIRDWALKEKPNILSMSFDEAFENSSKWHTELFEKSKNLEIDSTSEVDPERIIYKCADNVHFFYRLLPKELKVEGEIMGHCVGGAHYSSRLKRKEIEIISLRDKSNHPHVTIEIERKTGLALQVMGKGNQAPIDKYKKKITEFSLSIMIEQDKEILFELMELTGKKKKIKNDTKI